MKETEEDYVWKVVYNMNGLGLSDWLNEFHNTNEYSGTQHGEKVYTEQGFSFDKWPEWRWNCSYYFGGLRDAIEELEEKPNTEETIAILVFGICAALNLIDDDAVEPKFKDKFLFC
jgi:hypothetical protein